MASLMPRLMSFFQSEDLLVLFDFGCERFGTQTNSLRYKNWSHAALRLALR